MNDRNSGAVQSFPILGLLGILFVALKLTGHITWSWWWVLAPFWGGFALLLVLAILAGVIGVVASLLSR